MSPATPWFVLVAGINGAGKSTFAQDPATLQVLIEARGAAIEIINPDLVTREILEAGPEIDINRANVKAAEECERRVWNLVAKANRSFVIETVLSSDKYKPILRAALAKGFLVLFVYVVLDSVEEAIGRVANRVHHGGHDVPVEKIRSRWPKSLANLPWFWKHASRSLVYFNGSSVSEPVLMAERRGAEVSFLLDPPAPWALKSLLPAWKARRKKA